MLRNEGFVMKLLVRTLADCGTELVHLDAETARIAKDLREDPSLYFDTSSGFAITNKLLVLSHIRLDGIKNSARFMRLASEGKIPKRHPVEVQQLPGDDGRYLVKDGNSTVAVALAAGWVSTWCQEVVETLNAADKDPE